MAVKFDPEYAEAANKACMDAGIPLEQLRERGLEIYRKEAMRDMRHAIVERVAYMGESSTASVVLGPLLTAIHNCPDPQPKTKELSK